MSNELEKHEERRELKYCEHCGGLWVRDPGSGQVYCEPCRAKVSDLPVPKKRPGRLKLPVAPPTLVDRYAIDDDEDNDLEAAGGAA